MKRAATLYWLSSGLTAILASSASGQSFNVDIGRIDNLIAVVIPNVRDRRRSRGMSACGQHIAGVDVGIGRRIASVTDGIAIIKHLVGCQARVGIGQHRHLQPLVLDGVVVPNYGDLSRSVGTAPRIVVHVRGNRRRVPGTGVVVVANAETEVFIAG